MEKTLFGEKLKKVRMERGLTQEKLAEILGTSKQVISRYEKCQRNPKLITVEDYANKLNISLGSFVSEKPAEYPSEYQELIGELEELSREDIKSLLGHVKAIKGYKSKK